MTDMEFVDRRCARRAIFSVFGIFVAFGLVWARAQDDSAASQENITPPKVGIIFSAYSNEEQLPKIEELGGLSNFAGQAQSYFFHNMLVPALRSLGYDLYAIVEPGTADKGRLVTTLQKLKLTDRVIDGTDADALKKLDVIASMMNFNMREEVLTAIESAVHEGVGFFSWGFFGSLNPGNTEALHDFLGLDQSMGNLHYYDQRLTLIPVPPAELRVGLFASASSDIWKVSGIAGFTGIVDGTPIMQMPQGSDENLCPAYIRNYGKGRMLIIQLTVNLDLPTANMLALRTEGQYGLNWAAGRRLDANWRSLQVAAAEKAAATAAASSSPADSTPAPLSPADLAKLPPRVGFILGKLSDNPPHYANPDSNVDYFGNLSNVIGAFEEVGCVTYGITDPGIDEDARTHEMVDNAAFRGRMLDPTNSTDMAKVDVILSYFDAHLSVELLKIIQQRVQTGTGFFAMGEIASDDPEGNEILGSLLGLKVAPENLKAYPNAHPGKIVSHPDFTGSPHEPGQAINFWHVVGYEGQPTGDPFMTQDDTSVQITPGYTRRVGDGRVMVLQCWSAYGTGSGPQSFLVSENLTYVNEAVNWTAGKPISSTWAPTPRLGE